MEAIVAEGFERIHRTNLVGMGVLPLQFKEGQTRLTLGIDGSRKTYDGRVPYLPVVNLRCVYTEAMGKLNQ